jgi:hypothetical protein
MNELACPTLRPTSRPDLGSERLTVRVDLEQADDDDLQVPKQLMIGTKTSPSAVRPRKRRERSELHKRTPVPPSRSARTNAVLAALARRVFQQPVASCKCKRSALRTSGPRSLPVLLWCGAERLAWTQMRRRQGSRLPHEARGIPQMGDRHERRSVTPSLCIGRFGSLPADPLWQV